jgi:hypothetical protein
LVITWGFDSPKSVRRPCAVPCVSRCIAIISPMRRSARKRISKTSASSWRFLAFAPAPLRWHVVAIPPLHPSDSSDRPISGATYYLRDQRVHDRTCWRSAAITATSIKHQTFLGSQ